MAQIIGTPKFQAFDINGDPLVLGKLYSYVATTLTLTPTYPTLADAAASTNANTNPITLDSRGEANVVIKGATKLILKTSDGTTIWTFDNITDSASGTFEEIKDANGVTILSFPEVLNAVNYVTIGNATTGNKATISTAGADASVGLIVSTKASGAIEVTSPTTITPLLTASAGISFGQTTLAHYQENLVWTPTFTLSGGSGNVNPVYSSTLSTATRIGNIIHCNVLFLGDGGAEGAGTGQFSLSLPTAVRAGMATNGFIPIGTAINATTDYILYGQFQQGLTALPVYYVSGVNLFAGFSGSLQNNASRQVRFQFFYFID